ncbi:MAG: hypothetical protein ACYTEQ_01815 [Planctomycetota bacterium]|jgi:hypothetical protein
MEHTSLELSKRLHEKGFRGEHFCSWMISCVDKQPFCGDNENSVAHERICPTYTFTEIWPTLTTEQQLAVSSWIHEAETPVEAIGQYKEHLIDNGHVEVDSGQL